MFIKDKSLAMTQGIVDHRAVRKNLDVLRKSGIPGRLLYLDTSLVLFFDSRSGVFRELVSIERCDDFEFLDE